MVYRTYPNTGIAENANADPTSAVVCQNNPTAWLDSTSGLPNTPYKAFVLEASKTTSGEIAYLTVCMGLCETRRDSGPPDTARRF